MAGRTTLQLRLATVTAAAALVILLAATQATEARFLDICTHTAYPALCRPLLKGKTNPRRATHRMITVLETRTKAVIADADRFKKGNQAIATCHATLTDAMYNLANARKCIRKRNVMSLNKFLTAAVSDYGTCVDGFIETRQVNTLQNAADEMRKISTNCLSLSTLIR